MISLTLLVFIVSQTAVPDGESMPHDVTMEVKKDANKVNQIPDLGVRVCPQSDPRS